MPAKPPVDAGSGSATPPSKPCPECGKPSTPATAPFCSPRCRDRDLAHWLTDGYAVPGPPADPEEMVREQD